MDNKNDGLFQVSVKGLFFDEEGKIMMIQEENGLWEIPGGRIQKGENLLECLARECLEETGLTCQVIDGKPSIAYSAIDHKGRPRLMLFYKVRFENLDFKPSVECVEIKFFSKEEMKALNTYPQIEKLSDFL